MHYNDKISFEWDEVKNAQNIETRNLSFEYATNIFLDKDLLVTHDERHDYGESRYVAMGKIDKRLYVVIFTMRENTHRIISARKANSREVKQYEEIYT